MDYRAAMVKYIALLIDQAWPAGGDVDEPPKDPIFTPEERDELAAVLQEATALAPELRGRRA